MPSWSETPLALWLGLQAARPGDLSSMACPVHPGMTQFSFVLSAAIKPSFMQLVRTAVAFSWAQMHRLKGRLLFSLSLDNSVYRGTSAIIKINASYMVTHNYKEFIQNVFLFCLGYHFFLFLRKNTKFKKLHRTLSDFWE